MNLDTSCSRFIRTIIFVTRQHTNKHASIPFYDCANHEISEPMATLGKKNNCKRTPKRQTWMDNPGIQYDRNQFKKIFFLNQLYYNQGLTQNPYGKRTWGHHHNQLKDKSAPRFDEKYKFRISSIYTKFRNMGPCWTPCQ